MAKWLVPALRCLTFPLAVSRNRFLVDLCVFCLDIEARQSLKSVISVANGWLSFLFRTSLEGRGSKFSEDGEFVQG